MKSQAASKPTAERKLSVEEVWQLYDAQEQRLTSPVSTRMVNLAGLEPGMCVLDLATGRGEPALAAARQVRPSGRVVGIDVSQSMLAMASARAKAESITNLELMVADAHCLSSLQSAQFEAVLARWGLMYMSDPVQVLRNTRSLCKPGARLVAAVWAEPERVDYISVPCQVLAQFATVPSAASSSQPGTFRFSNLDVIVADFESAGWMIHSIEEMVVPVMQARSGDEFVHWCECFGMNRLMQGLSEDIKQSWRKAMQAKFVELRDELGHAYLGGVTRIVVAD